jgi:hypothetical protein
MKQILLFFITILTSYGCSIKDYSDGTNRTLELTEDDRKNKISKHSHGFDLKKIKQDSITYMDYLNTPYKLITTDTNETRKVFIYKNSLNSVLVDSSSSFNNYTFTKTTENKIIRFLEKYVQPTEYEGTATIHLSLLFNKSGKLVKTCILDSVDYGCFKTGHYKTTDKTDLKIPKSELPNNKDYFELQVEWVDICYCTCLIKK